ncbi:MAG: rRNA maturation RNase YbeY [Methylococcaceae bacterium]|nr:rRNA maturation RNase YbeY [Methylococcaceae bacterium]MDD1609362.1 rRNA maturation RNase YbeY [Methylococcaceae bacterium]MDD1615801.1 rRNA maturation RNase YbeY [Methylococcaceae bacterium]OYV19401.1 MAG: putative rRNA maturation factor [Methylococcaceae bacterium NSP1-2]
MNSIEIQTIFESAGQPSEAQIQLWIDTALEDVNRDTEIVVRIVDEQESAELNQQYRHKKGATNILSFPVEIPEGIDIDLNLLGDLVICAPVLEQEAQQQGKVLADHWAHIIIHGVLHLLGYDHLDDEQAEEMESKEIALLQQLNINNPYQQEVDQ